MCHRLLKPIYFCVIIISHVVMICIIDSSEMKDDQQPCETFLIFLVLANKSSRRTKNVFLYFFVLCIWGGSDIYAYGCRAFFLFAFHYVRVQLAGKPDAFFQSRRVCEVEVYGVGGICAVTMRTALLNRESHKHVIEKKYIMGSKSRTFLRTRTLCIIRNMDKCAHSVRPLCFLASLSLNLGNLFNSH